MNGSRLLRSLGMLSALGLVSACAVAPNPITQAEHALRAQADYEVLFKDQPPMVRPLTVEEATARALKYNYDHQLAMVEVTLQNRQFDMAVLNMLPRLALSAGYNARSNESASSSLSVLTRRQSLEPSTSQDKERWTADLSFSWNLLDFGVGYFQARQQGDRALIAVERRRRVINNIVKEVRIAYWRAATAQRLLPKIDPLLDEANRALEANAQIERETLEPVLQTLEYRKNLLQVTTQLRRLKSDLSVAKAQLAALINVPPSSDLRLEEPPDQVSIPRTLSADLKGLEKIGLAQRPELREEAYQERVDRNNLYKEIVRMVPGLSLLGSYNYDSNSYLWNNLWAEAGVRVTQNLVSLITAPQTIGAAEAQIQVARTRRLALSVAVLTQINVGYQQYMRSVESFDAAQEVANVERRIAKAVADGGLAEAEPEFERIRRGLSAVAAELERDRALTDLQASLANLYTSLGIDVLSPSIETDDLEALTKSVRLSFDDLNQGRMPTLTDLESAPEAAAKDTGPDTAASTQTVSPAKSGVPTS